MFETIEKPYKINEDEECFDYNADDVLDVITSCEKEIIKRFEWLRLKLLNGVKKQDKTGEIFSWTEVDNYFKQAKTLPIEKIEEELK